MSDKVKKARMESKKQFQSWHISEPYLIFGNGKTHIDPKLGLTLYGPLRAEGAKMPAPLSIKLGIIGTGETAELASRWLQRLTRKIEGKNHDPFQSPTFPGFRQAFDCTIVLSESYNENILNPDIDNIALIPTFEGRVERAVQLFIDKIEAINEKSANFFA